MFLKIVVFQCFCQRLWCRIEIEFKNIDCISGESGNKKLLHLVIRRMNELSFYLLPFTNICVFWQVYEFLYIFPFLCDIYCIYSEGAFVRKNHFKFRGLLFEETLGLVDFYFFFWLTFFWWYNQMYRVAQK